jgi:hypothetical protein
MLHRFPSVDRYRNCDDTVELFVVGRLGAPHPEQPERIFKLWFVALMALISWGAALILPVRSKLLGSTWTAATFGLKIHASESSLANAGITLMVGSE